MEHCTLIHAASCCVGFYTLPKSLKGSLATEPEHQSVELATPLRTLNVNAEDKVGHLVNHRHANLLLKMLALEPTVNLHDERNVPRVDDQRPLAAFPLASGDRAVTSPADSCHQRAGEFRPHDRQSLRKFVVEKLFVEEAINESQPCSRTDSWFLRHYALRGA